MSLAQNESRPRGLLGRFRRGASSHPASLHMSAWPFEQIGRVIAPTAQQPALLDELKAAAAQAANDLKVSCTREAVLQAVCPDSIPQTPVGQLDAIEKRLETMIKPPRPSSLLCKSSMRRSAMSRSLASIHWVNGPSAEELRPNLQIEGNPTKPRAHPSRKHGITWRSRRRASKLGNLRQRSH
jgi:hypothetical protein